VSARLEADNPVWRVEAGQPFLMEVAGGAPVVVSTLDCRGGSIRTPDDLWQVENAEKINPVTGPVGVEGAAPGDTLAVWIDDVAVADQGLMLVRPTTTLFDFVDRGALEFARVTGSDYRLGDRDLPLRPMVGWVGLQPAAGTVATSASARTGGNMDTPLVRAGARVLLPVEVDGAGLYVGDVHASQGDGELFLTGVEIAATVQVRAEVLGDVRVDGPLVETADTLAVLGVDGGLEESAQSACRRGLQILTVLNRLSSYDAGFLLSAACDLRVSRYLPHYGSVCRLEIPKHALDQAALSADGWLRSDLGELERGAA
jgi:amidase